MNNRRHVESDAFSSVAAFSPYAARWLRFWLSRAGLAVLLVLVVLGLCSRGYAQVGAPHILGAAQVAAFEQLVTAAKGVDPQFLQAQATEAQKRGELSPIGAVSATMGVGVSLGTSGGFDQVTPGYRLSASLGVDLVSLSRRLDSTNAAQLAALTASTSAAGRDLRVRVLQAFTAYLSAVRAAGVAADALELAGAALQQQQARAVAGVSTGVDVLRASQARNSADADLYDANLRLAVAKQQLSAITGLTMPGLDRALTGAKPTP